jgi:hypothetical protein
MIDEELSSIERSSINGINPSSSHFSALQKYGQLTSVLCSILSVVQVTPWKPQLLTSFASQP